MTVMIAGIVLGLSIIVAIGPQNVLLIKQGIRREAVGLVVTICLLSDVVLITGATLGAGALVQKAPALLVILRWAGVAYLMWFAFNAFRDAWRPGSITTVEETAPTDSDPSDAVPGELPLGSGQDGAGQETGTTLTRSRAPVSKRERLSFVTRTPEWRIGWTTLALTWLNPGAWIDSLVVIGGVANQYGETDRWIFAAGALIASAIWFPAVGFGARLVSGPLSKPQVWRVLNVIIGLSLIAIAAKLALM